MCVFIYSYVCLIESNQDRARRDGASQCIGMTQTRRLGNCKVYVCTYIASAVRIACVAKFSADDIWR